MKRILALFCLCVAAYAQPNCSQPTIRCVGAPWQYPSIQAAVDAMLPGATVYAPTPGIYPGFKLTTPHISGTANSRLTVIAAPGVTIGPPGDSKGNWTLIT